MASGGLRIDAARETDRIVAFIRSTVGGAGAEGVEVSLSGGIDSSVVGALCVRALGKDKVVGLLLPSEHTPPEDAEDARGLASAWGIRTETIQITKTVKTVLESSRLEGTRVASANVQARVRMTIAYYFANTLQLLVAGTGDKSEETLGFFTKGGDGLADFLPIAHLYKTQVRLLGAYLGLPSGVVEKPASPQLWPGHKATDELPADYDKLDIALHRLFDLKSGVEEAAAEAGLPVSAVEKALEMHRRTAHKRALPPSLE